MQSFLNKLRELPQYQQLLTDLNAGKTLFGLGLPRSARLPVLAALHENVNRPILLVTDRADHALSLFDELGFWLKSPRFLFAEPNPLFYEQAAWGTMTRRDRLQALTLLAAYHMPGSVKPQVAPIIAGSVRALMTRTLPRREFIKFTKVIKVGQRIAPDVLIRAWADQVAADLAAIP